MRLGLALEHAPEKERRALAVALQVYCEKHPNVVTLTATRVPLLAAL
jgi:hypothetical protein